MQGYLKGINNLEGKDESEKLIKLNDLITLWNKNKARKHVGKRHVTMFREINLINYVLF